MVRFSFLSHPGTSITNFFSRHTATLNEFRAFFDLKPHDSFEDINGDPEVADILRNLYDHPDMVELYPGLFVEEAKARMDPGCGGCPPYTVGRAVFSDAVTLVRSDRFYTLVGDRFLFSSSSRQLTSPCRITRRQL